MNALTFLVLIAAQDLPRIETPDPPPIEQRVTALESRMDAVERLLASKPMKVVPTIAPVTKDGKETYEAGRARAIREGKPMIVWAGTALCPACVAANADEFVHHVTANFHGLTSALVVGLPVQGELLKIATKLEWPEGHIPTVRQAIADYRAGRATMASSPPQTTYFNQQQYRPQYQPQFQMQYQPQRRMRSSG